jgi:rfaE bifunctional protein nucleotidyltransferase chain/domain
MTGTKVRSRAAARRWRRGQHGGVVFTNGVFDLLHRGHVELLEQARGMGDHLVVGVNDDASTAALGKGAGRPFVPVDDRVRILAALACVDCVVVFGERTPDQLIEELAPDVLVKGSDWDPDTLPGAATVRARGGTVRVVPLVPDRSTSALIARIRAAH